MAILLLLLTFTFTFFTSPTFAQTSTPSAAVSLQPTAYSLPSTISPTSPLYTDLLVNNLFHTFSCLAIGQSLIGQPCLTYQMTKNAQGAIQGIPMLSQTNTSGGLLGTTSNLIGMIFANPPLRTADYLADVGSGLGIVKEAHAQVTGSGASVLSPVLSLWTVSRNISYVILILIFLVIGLMVMFRNKINPQTVITAQTALPGLIIGLIFITFSYFFAALLVDTAFLGTNIVGAYFSAAQPTPPAGTTTVNNPDCPDPNNLSACLKNKNVLSIMSTFVGAIGQGDLDGAVSDMVDALGTGPNLILRSFTGFLSYQYATQFAELPATAVAGAVCSIAGVAAFLNPVADIAGTTNVVVSNVPGCVANATTVTKQVVGAAAFAIGAGSPATVISLALYVILIVILIYTMFKLLFRLVNCFISIIFHTIFAPFQFLAASLPGRQGIATGWILNMLCNILAFPAIIGVFYFVNYLFGFGIVHTPLPGTAGPLELTGQGTLPLFGGMGTNFIRLILAYGLLLATPSIPDIICRAIGKASQAGQLIGQEISGGSRAGSQYLGRYGQGIQGMGASLGGQRNWVFNPNKAGGAGFEYLQQTPGATTAVGILRRGVGGRNTPPLQKP